MLEKRILTKQRHPVGAYWEYVLGLCERLLLDLGNLPGRRGRMADHVPEGYVPDPGATDEPDPIECQRFREKWSPRLLGLGEAETDNDNLLDYRNHLRKALLHDGPEDLRVLAIGLANRPATAKWMEFTLLDGSPWSAPILFDFPRALAAALLSFSGKGHKLVCCPQCGRCVIGRSNQKFCPGGKCRIAWHRHQPESRKKWRTYMRDYMRNSRALEPSRRSFDRAQEKRRNQINRKLSRRKCGKAKKA